MYLIELLQNEWVVDYRPLGDDNLLNKIYG